MDNPWDLSYSQTPQHSMEEFKGRQLISGRRPDDVKEDVRQLTALQKADSTSTSLDNIEPWNMNYRNQGSPTGPGGSPAKPTGNPPLLDQEKGVSRGVYPPSMGGGPLPERKPWAATLDSFVNKALSPLESAMGWYESNIAKPFREMNFKEDPLQTLQAQRPDPMTPWHALKEAGVGMLADPSMALGGFRTPSLRGAPELSPPPIRASKPNLPATVEPPIPVLEPDKILGPKQRPPSGVQQLNPKVAKPIQPEPQPNYPIRGMPGVVEPPPEMQTTLGGGSPEPVVGTEPIPTLKDKWKKWFNREKLNWGQELPVIDRVPDSPVISQVEAVKVWPEVQLENLTEEPWVKAILKTDGKTWRQHEEQAVRIWKENGQDERAYNMALSQLPEPFQQMLRRRDQQLAIENEIRTRRGLEKIPMVHEPYFPRVTTQEWRELKSVYRSGEMRMGKTTVGPHMNKRYYETTREGMREGVDYKDPRHGFMSRETNGLNLQATDRMITGLEQAGVLHPTKARALEASPTGEVEHIEGIPFGPDRGGWWVRTKEEAQFLRQNLKGNPDNPLTAVANTYMRGPSLVNPWPHIIKNMASKLGMTTFASKGKMRNLVSDIWEYKNQSNPQMIERFKQVMPFSESGKNLHQIIAEQVPSSGLETVENTLAKMNQYSQKEIFAKWDPRMRYAKWKEYVRQGMSDQEAANHTWVDLIRYGTRADRIDFWRSIPANFFIPWRVGAIRTLYKAFKTNAVRLGAFVGLVDMIREWDYRHNNRWTHMPQDYFERPLMEAMHGRGWGALKTAATTAFAGPGGEYMLHTLEMILRDMQGRGEMKDFKSIYWGLAQLTDTVPEFKQAERTGKWGEWLTNTMGILALGRHATPYGAPPRFGEVVPEKLLPKSQEVKQSELKGKIARGEVDRGSGLPKLGVGFSK